MVIYSSLNEHTYIYILYIYRGKTLLILNVSFNNLTFLPPDLGNLLVLRELDVSSNKLERLCPEIGRLVRLKKLKANGNRLVSIPPEIGKCKLLEELILSENKIKEVSCCNFHFNQMQPI